jgi:transposase InsO family protein
LFFVILHKIANIKDRITVVKPETVLQWQRMIIKGFWTFTTSKKRGRKRTPKEIRHQILAIKNDNILWGVKKIQGELIKLNIYLDSKTIWNIIQSYRRKGKVRAYLNWKKFLKMNISSLYAMDFFTVDTIFNQRFYVFFIISHRTREIVRYAITQNPVKEFVRQQIIAFEDEVGKIAYLIHDNTRQFNLHYLSYGIKELRISIRSPNMNPVAERFVKSLRHEALDNFIIISYSQIKNILDQYIHYYNTQRPHQGISQQVPKKYTPQQNGRIIKMPILSGLHHHYYRRAA